MEKLTWSSTFSRYLQDLRSRAQLTKVSSSPIIYENVLPDGSKEVYSESDGGLTIRRVFLTGLIDPQGNSLTFDYDYPSGGGIRLISITDEIGQVTELEYALTADVFKVTKITDPFGREAIFDYDTSTPPRLESITDVIGLMSEFPAPPTPGESFTLTTPYGTTEFTYSSAASTSPEAWLEAEDPLGDVERFEFKHSATGISATESPVPSGAGITNNYLHYRNTFYWDKRVHDLYPGDFTKAKIYHWLHVGSTQQTSGFLESTREPLERRKWFRWQSQSDAVRMPADSAGVSRAYRVLDSGTTQNFVYKDMNGLGNVTVEKDARGREIRYTYDTNRIDLLNVKLPNDSGTFINVWQYSSYVNHKPQTVTDVAGDTITYTYNSRGQVLTETNQKNETTTYDYDSDGYLLEILGPGSEVLWAFTYDAKGRVETRTNVLGHTISIEYDDADRITKVTYPDSTFRETVYDKLDVDSVTDREGKVTSYTYNALRQLTSVTNAENETTSFDWCGCGQLGSILDPLGHLTEWERDIQGRVITKYYDDGEYLTYTYESSTSRLASILDPLGQTTNFAWHLDDRLQTISFTNPVNATTSIGYSYDTKYPRLTSMTDATGTTAFNYNSITASSSLGQGRLMNVNGPLTNDTVSYTYDELGRYATNTTFGGIGETYTYDALGRLDTKVSPLGTFSYTYEGDSDQETSSTVALSSNNLEATREYLNDLGDHRLERLKHLVGTTTISDFEYQYSPEGIISEWTGAYTVNVSGTPTLGDFDPTYDDTYRLLSSDVIAGSTIKSYGYTYDDADNRLTSTEDSTIRTFSVNSVNQITGITNPSQTLTHDDNGNLTAISSGPSYEYDALNRVIAVVNGTNRSEFTYNGFHQLSKIVEKVSGVTQRTKNLIWCGERICEERDSVSGTTLHYPEGYKEGSNLYYYVRDHLGSIRSVVNTSGTLIGEYQYDPYGKMSVVPGTSTSVTPAFGYTGLYNHSVSGLQFALYRAYNPELGRWLNRDPIAERGGLNLYSYSDNNVFNGTDRDGLLPVYNGSDQDIPYKPEFGDGVKICPSGAICLPDGIYPPDFDDMPVKVPTNCGGYIDSCGNLRLWCIPVPFFDDEPPFRVTPPFLDEHPDWPKPESKKNSQ